MVDPEPQRATPLTVIRSLTFTAAFYLITAVFLVLGAWLLLVPRQWAMAGLALHSRTCLVLLRLICGTHIKVRGRENIPAGGCLIVAKHQSAWDTFALIPLFRDPAIVLKDELKWIPVYGWFCVKFGHIFVRRDKASAALKALIADARLRIAGNREIIIFPEGTRAAPGAKPDYKPGYVALYEALGVPAVPLALNSGLYWPRRSLMRYPGTIIVSVLPPLPPGLPRTEFRRAMEASIEAETARLVGDAQGSTTPPPMPDAR
ncbi:MAG: 1-acyl-sn-glycerol-3-phosphate acyltransferase [Hyphomicrobium sp.]|nr:1-acyl-sn-glycerol-3-phosphate acyltransferase [Hyphomicrobium sp.]